MKYYNAVMMSDAGGYVSPSYQITVNSSSYGSDLYMDEKAVDQAIEIVNELDKKLYDVFSELMEIEDSLRKKQWWSAAANFYPEILYNHKFFSPTDNNVSVYPGNKLLSIYHGDVGLSNFKSAPSFNGLASSLDEIKQAIINYSNGVDMDNAITSLRTWLGDDFNQPNSSVQGNNFSSGTVNTPIEKTTTSTETPVIDIPSLGTDVEMPSKSPDIMDSEVIDFDDVDGADNVTVKDSVTDDIVDVSSDDLIKDSSSVGIPGVASIIGSTTRNGILAAASGIGAGILSLNDDTPLETLDTDIDDIEGTDVSGSFSDAVSNFITPNVGTMIGKKIKSASAGVSAIAATVSGVGTLSAGAVGGKVYMDKKKKDGDNDDEEEINYDDDDFFDRKEETVEEPNNSSIVDFKNEILNDNL